MSIKVNDLEKAILDTLSSERDRIKEVLEREGENITKEAVKKLQETSPVGRRKKYAKGWTYKKQKRKYIVYNKEYRLTHLLEKGHQKVTRTGKVKGRTKAIPHIGNVETMVINEFQRKVKRGISSG